ncbi:putative pectin methyltransferase QUA2 [Hibiscus syriacus]|uniref:Methyltransferase n=1 Tax=Hibiscus syriacus TaxID=106335 RepID=A0A6A3CQE9_HIBSY|nr:putative pectin methyltransferase QUA2 [Hibiscus syriacus]
MSRPLHRGVSGIRNSGDSNEFWDSKVKDKMEKGDLDRNRPSDPSYLSLSIGAPRRHKLTVLFLKLSLVVIMILALTGSFWWTLSISTSSRGHIFHGYRRLQEQLVSDLWDIGDLSLGTSRMKEIYFCPGSRKNCLVPPPVNYKIPLRWPTGRDVIWVTNVKISGQEIAEMIGLRNESNFIQAGVRTILDIGCGYGSFGAHLFSKQLLTMCIANCELSGSQVQLALESGLPAMIGSFKLKQLPYPYLSFDTLHCARSGIDWDKKDGILLIEVDRVLKPGGYFVWTSPLTNVHSFLRQGIESPYYRPLQNCIGGTHSRRWLPIEERPTWPSRSKLNKNEQGLYAIISEELNEDTANNKTAVRNYWSLLSTLIFSDHSKRPGDEYPSPPYNMFRNVLDMNARFVGLNAALLEAGKSVWVMNVVSTTGPNYLPLILDRGYVGVLHDWCEAFPTYPRTYDMVHAGLLSLDNQHARCTILDIFTEIDWLLRPEGWVIIRDTAPLIGSARALTTRLKWDARVVEIESNSDERLLIHQKPFFKRQAI